jgi:hypothetical protein
VHLLHIADVGFELVQRFERVEAPEPAPRLFKVVSFLSIYGIIVAFMAGHSQIDMG